MTRTLRRSTLLAAALIAAACGSPNPPPPVATPTPGATVAGLRPLSSREVGAPAQAPGGAAAPRPTEAALPPGHPPIQGVPTPADAAALPPGHPAIEGRPVPAGPLGGQAESAGGISGTVILSPRLQAQVSTADVLYVMAKKGNATLAVRREEKVRFPFRFEISGGDAMVAGTSLQGPVDLIARLSRTGDAIASKGDLEGVTKGVSVPSKGVTIVIDRVRD